MLEDDNVDLLTDLKGRLDRAGSKVELICVDDCCHVRNKYNKIFPNTQVKLPATHALHKDAFRDFVQIFMAKRRSG